MRNKSYLIIFILSAVLMTTGCIRKDAVIVYNVADFNISLRSSPSVELIVPVENTLKRNITISDAMLQLTDGKGNSIAKVIVCNDLFLPKRSTTDLLVPLKLSIDNPLRGLALLNDIERNMSAVFVSGQATVKAGCFRKRINIGRMSLTDFMDRLGYINAGEQSYMRSEVSGAQL